MEILVTGGAGYIGSAAVKKLVEAGYKVVVVDNLSRGQKSYVNPKAKFYQLDLTDAKGLARVFEQNHIDAVMHFAAYKAVGESMANAGKYSDNITGTITLLSQMVKFGVKKMVYSSSCAVYGMPEVEHIDECTPTKPINYYGYTKLSCEQIIDWYAKIHNIKYVSLRYFNVAGDAGLNYIDQSAENIIPIIIEVIVGTRKKLTIFGKDYSTRDGTCVRDYIDVSDLIEAHILALKLEKNAVINLGTGKGASVQELVDTAIEVTGKRFSYEFGPRRKGDPACLIASNAKAKKLLGWSPKTSLKQMLKSTYQAYTNK
ncbi:MAG: UDP-glucose 4-epimerase GalE [Candidatus Woesearchaeota archaeon]